MSDYRTEVLAKAEKLLAAAFESVEKITPEQQQSAAIGAIAYVLLARGLK